ncbi:TetR/AcrR family transcriptional regulator [Saccharibacillus sp. JS10]|uniref:TetR/AcrR family transcriptional regulator n=1 Tax=Saccharibacillus sp. JS10 TaxID=2950552 RepID=UPI00210A5E15|nr:TetR/AcrR family transcriptional regulator [Saccharibacillus sp. JS10]MCQ4087824.1 TetR/AcrR family transcriptional regulator [Saccharibacillus sp. JS10]
MSEKSNARDNIISTAARLFFSQGYHATGLSQIVKESQAPKGSLYHYFPNGKEELASICIQQTNELILQKFEDTFAAHKSAADGIHQFVQDMAHETEAAGFTGFLPFSFWAAVETSCISQNLRKMCQGVFADWQRVIARQLIHEGMETAKAEDTGLLIISLLEGALIISLTNQDKQPLLTASNYMAAVTKHAKEIQSHP